MGIPVGFGKSLEVADWFYSLLKEFIRAGATAVMSGVVISADDPGGDYPFLGGKFFMLIFKLFVASGLLLGVMPFLKEHALPEWKRTTTKTETIEASEDPPSLKTTTVVEEHVEKKP